MTHGRRRKRRKPTYPPLTAVARQIYRGCFGEPMPKGWRVEYVGFMRGALGLCVEREQRILVSWGDLKRSDALETIVHECVHVRHPKLRHGAEFRRLETRAMSRLWEAALAEANQRECGERRRRR